MIQLNISGETLTLRECNAIIAFCEVMGGRSTALTTTHTLKVEVDTTQAQEQLERLAAHPTLQTMGDGDPADMPDAGAVPAAPASITIGNTTPGATLTSTPAAISAFAAFQHQAAGTGVPNGVSSGAVAAPSSTAPVVNLGISAPAPNASIPSAPPAPTAVAQPAAPIPSAPVDSEGLPWDARIHASTRSTIGAGTWKLARGVDKALVESVKAELRTIMAIPNGQAGASGAATSIPAAPSSAPGNFPFPPPNAAQPSATPQTMGMSPASAPGISPQGNPSASAGDLFAQLMDKIIPLVAANRITQSQIVEACIECGFTSLPLVAARPDMIPNVSAAIDRRTAPAA